jgi:hypothetical protein
VRMPEQLCISMATTANSTQVPEACFVAEIRAQSERHCMFVLMQDIVVPIFINPMVSICLACVTVSLKGSCVFCGRLMAESEACCIT